MKYIIKTFKKYIAFTLAETLLVMGIIGVVAALTIPNVNNSTGNAEKVARVKTIYADLNEAHRRAVAKYGPVQTWFVEDDCYAGNSNTVSCRQRYFDRVTEFMKISKLCRANNNGKCVNTIGTKALGIGANFSYDASFPSAIMNNGISFSVYLYRPKFNSTSVSGNNSGGYFLVDIDGPNKGKNTAGIDIFLFGITKTGIVPWTTTSSYWTNNSIKEWCFYRGTGCSGWVINTGNMDYLDASHTSSSDAGVCNKSSKQLSTTVTSCR